LQPKIDKNIKIQNIENEVSLELTTGKATPDVAISLLTEDDWFNDEIRVTVPPLSVIEIVSPTQGIDEIKDKIMNIYFAAGVKSAWIVIPTLQSVFVLTPDKKIRTFTSGIIKDEVVGIELDMQDIFPKKP
jgi:Uma2 family endonuclease